MRFVVAGGGTGGHIYPALAIARGLQARYQGSEILYVGARKGMESDIVPKEGLPFKGISAAGLERKLSPRNLKSFWLAGRGILQAWSIIGKYKPDAVIGTGGYVCGPVVLAAAFKGIPTLIHEQNALPGITNRILARFASMVAITFEDSAGYFPKKDKVYLTGLPVRPEILQANHKTGMAGLGLDGDRFVLLSFGGSRGARTINKAMVDVIKTYSDDPRIHIIHVTGKDGYEEFMGACSQAGIDMDSNGNVTIKSYLYNMQDALAAADLVISRAGAATLAEITALGLPSILIPYPFASENHQEYNARAMEKEGAALVVLDQELSGEALCRQLSGLLGHKERLSGMASASRRLGKPRAMENILDCLGQLLKKGKK